MTEQDLINSLLQEERYKTEKTIENLEFSYISFGYYNYMPNRVQNIIVSQYNQPDEDTVNQETQDHFKFQIIDIQKEKFADQNIFTVLFAVPFSDRSKFFDSVNRYKKSKLIKTSKGEKDKSILLNPYSTNIIHTTLVDLMTMCESILYENSIDVDIDNKIKEAYKKTCKYNKGINILDEL